MKEKRNKTGNVPNLRFKGFEGEWEEKKLAEVAEKINSGKTPLGGEAIYTAKGILFIRSQNVNNDRLELENSVFIPEEINREMKNSIVHANDILLNITGASLGRSCVVPNDFKIGNVNQHVCIIRLHKEFMPRFIQPILSSTKGQNIFQSLQTGSGREGLNFENIKNIELSFPSLTEQQKIASFLSLIDERIDTQSKIIQGLETLIQGLREKLFTQKLRFKDEDGQQFPDWEVMQLGDISEKKSSMISANKIEDNFGEYIIYGASGILKKIDFFIEREDYISIVKDGAGVGRLLYCEGQSSVLGTMDIIKPKQNMNTYFLFHLLKNIDFTKYVTGSTIPHIYFKDYKNENIVIPSLPEQTLIANFLSDIDGKINVEKSLLQQMQNQKKYLLQNLFI